MNNYSLFIGDSAFSTSLVAKANGTLLESKGRSQSTNDRIIIVIILIRIYNPNYSGVMEILSETWYL